MAELLEDCDNLTDSKRHFRWLKKRIITLTLCVCLLILVWITLSISFLSIENLADFFFLWYSVASLFTKLCSLVKKEEVDGTTCFPHITLWAVPRCCEYHHATCSKLGVASSFLWDLAKTLKFGVGAMCFCLVRELPLMVFYLHCCEQLWSLKQQPLAATMSGIFFRQLSTGCTRLALALYSSCCDGSLLSLLVLWLTCTRNYSPGVLRAVKSYTA